MFFAETHPDLTAFREHLIREEKSAVTVEKYLRDAGAFLTYAAGERITKDLVLSYKESIQQQYALQSVNSMLASVNSFLSFLGLQECRVKNLRCQRQTYCPEEKELSKEEYRRLLNAARGNPQLQLILQTICATGIRVSELCYFTVEAVAEGEISVRCKSKTRKILLPGKLRKLLKNYAAEQGITAGVLFCNRKGAPLNRSSIWRRMKQLCAAAGVLPEKVFPHNLRKLFARTFYHLDKDIAKLADLLGHSSINTTRIYLMTSGTEHRRQLNRMGLVLEMGRRKVT